MRCCPLSRTDAVFERYSCFNKKLFSLLQLNRDDGGRIYPPPSPWAKQGYQPKKRGAPLAALHDQHFWNVPKKQKLYNTAFLFKKRFTCMMFFAFCRFVSLRGWLVPVMTNANCKFDPSGNFHEIAIRVCREDGRCPRRNHPHIWKVTHLRKTNYIIVHCLPI